MTRSIRVYIFLFLFPLTLYPQNQNIRFEHLTVDNGLSNNFINSIVQDSLGFIWFATEDGLNKFDGYTFTVYRHDPNDSTSLSENKIKVLQVGKNGIIWVGTDGGGLNAFNPQTKEFTRYNMDPDDLHGINKKYIYDMYIDKNDRLWISVMGWGLYRFDTELKKLNRYAHNPDDSNSISSNLGLLITSTINNGKELIWVGSWGGGLNQFDLEQNKWTHYWHDPNNTKSLSDNYISNVYADNSGFLWISTGNAGLDKLNPQTGIFTNYRNDPSNSNSISDNMIGQVWEKDGILWITTARGLNRLHIKNEELISYIHNPSDPASIGQNRLLEIYESKSGLLWIGGWAGLDILDFEQKPFVTYRKEPGNPNSLSDYFAGAILETKQHNNDILWIGTKDGGLNKINRQSGQFTHYQHNPADPNSLSGNFVFGIAESFYQGKKELWLGTLSGLNRFDPQTGKFTHYRHNPDDTTSISEDYIHGVYAGRNGYIWIGTRNKGLCRFDLKTQKFRRYYHGPGTGEIWIINEDTSGFLWYGSVRRGLIKLDPLADVVTYYSHNPRDANSISSNTIRSIHESFAGGEHILWVGTNAGLNRFDYKTEQFRHYSRKDGLPNNEINGILEDKQGNLWLSTGHGLSKFDPVSGSIRNFDKDDGLPGNQFLRGFYYQGKNGEMFFSCTNGFTSFFPEQIKDNLHIPEIVLTDFQIFNKSIPVKNDGLTEGNIYFLSRHISGLSHIELSYDQSVFSFEFAALDFRKPQKNRYAYMMEGVDPGWVYTNASRRFATYTNLDPGEYTFRVKGSNNDDVWNEEGTSIKVIITPPWWETQLAYILYFVFFIVVIVTTWRAQIRRIHLRQQLKMEHFEAEKLREVDQLKSRFFSNISHEFRTPLTLIEGPVRQIMDGTFAGNLKQHCQMILRNSHRLLGLINQILDLSKLESGETKLQVTETDIVPYLKGLIQTFSPLADRKKAALKFTSRENVLIGYIDHDKLEKIITNLLSNAFKFTPEGGEIIVTLKVPNSKYQMPNKSKIPNSQFQILNSDFVEIVISNTGPGIPTDQLDKIFDRFYQAENKLKIDGEGTGIGLALTKELVELCRGQITVSSMPGKTTTFTVTLPITRAYFKNDEISDSPQISPPLEKGDRGMLNLEMIANHSDEITIKSKPKKSTPLLLIVEDNPDVVAYIRSFMDSDYLILIAENGKEGLKKALDKYPDIVISDVMMPEMDGFEFCQKIKSDGRLSHIPVILLTAKADLDSRIEGLEFGADDYVTKPFEGRELQIRSRNLIEQRRKLREKFSSLINMNPQEIAASSMDEQLLQRLLAVFEDHIEEPDFSIEQLARDIGMNRRHLNRKIKAMTNLSTRHFIRTLRLQRAAKLLGNASGTVSEIAYKVGFNNLSYFTRAFREHFGQLPSEFTGKK